MAAKDSNYRMTVSFGEELNRKLDILAGYQNVSKNACINNLLETTIDAQIKIWEMMKNPESLEKLINLASLSKDKTTGNQIKVLQDIMSGKTVEGFNTADKAEEMMAKLKKK